MPEPAQAQDGSVTFNVVFTPGSVELLLPFSLSLLQSPSVGVRLVGNACTPPEVELLRAACGVDDRLSHHRLPGEEHPVEHGEALNHLFEAFPEPRFAFIDSDVIASGDFMASLWPPSPGSAAAFAAAAASWVAEDEEIADPRQTTLGGAKQALHDGTFIGNTFCAIYDRAAIEPAWRQAPRGFGAHHWHGIPRPVRDELEARGWRYRTYDTGRLINLTLLLAGHRLERRAAPELHHVGALSNQRFRGWGGAARRLAAIRSRPDGRLRLLAHGVLNRLYFRFQRDPLRERRRERARIVRPYLNAALGAVRRGERPPEPPETDSPDVDRRLAALVAALESEYPRAVSELREVVGAYQSGGT